VRQNTWRVRERIAPLFYDVVNDDQPSLFTLHLFSCWADVAPEVQVRMHELLESNPDNLPEVIEQDPELKALRDANPLCAELMNDPETMKILIEPDNLRALGECPDLIAADFSDPTWTPPDVENATFDDAMAPPEPTELPVEPDGTEEVVIEEVGPEEEEEDEGFLEGFEREEEDDARGAAGKKAASKRGSTARDSSQGGNGVSAYITSLGTGLVDYVAGETVGVTLNEVTGMGGEEDVAGLTALEDQVAAAEEQVAAVEETAAAADEAQAATLNSSLANLASCAADAGEYAASDDVAGTLQDNMEKIEEAHDKQMEDSGMSTGAVAGTAVGGTVVMGGGAAAVVARQRRNRGPEDSLDLEDDLSPKRTSVVGLAGSFVRSSVSTFATAATAQLATSFLGEDLGESFMEKMEASSDKLAEEEGAPRGSVIRRARRTARSSLLALGEAAKETVATTLLGDDLGEDLLERMEGEEEDEDKPKDGADEPPAENRRSFGTRR
jgi:hypothetical protein